LKSVAQSNENHEALFSVFRWPDGTVLTTMCSVPVAAGSAHRQPTVDNPTEERTTMWTKPEFTEMRFGFEVTMYIYNR